MKHQGWLTAAGLLLWSAALLRWNQEAAQAAREGLALCSGVIVPSLFPFFVLSSLVVSLGVAARLGRLLSPVMEGLFGLSGESGCALAVGLLAGYPVGAATVRKMVENGTVSPEEGERLLSFCNNCGPAFLLGAAGSGVFGSLRAGLVLLLCHALGDITVGLVLCRRGRTEKGAAPEKTIQSVQLFTAFTAAVRGALSSTLSVCAYVVLFSVLVRLLRESGLLGFIDPFCALFHWDCTLVSALLTGTLELSAGTAALSGCNPVYALPAASFILGFGGLSVQCQTMAVLEGSGLSVRLEVLGKLLHGVFSTLWTVLFLQFVPLAADTQGGGLRIFFHLPLLTAAVLWVAFAAWLFSKKGSTAQKGSGNSGTKRV